MRSSSRNKQIRAIIASLILICLAIGLFIFRLNRAAMIPENADASFKEYSKYLSYTKGNQEDIKVYLDPIDNYEFNYYLTIYNNTDDYYCGVIELLAKEETAFTYKVINMKPQEVKMLGLYFDKAPDDYRLKKTKFYSFNYPSPVNKAYLSQDSDKDYEYVWNNLLFEKEIDEEMVMEWAEYLYIQDVLAGKDSPDTYCYSPDSVLYDEIDGVKYPQLDSAVMGIIIDHDRNNIKVVDLITEEILQEKEMK